MTPRRVELLRDLDRPTGWVLLVDGVEQSYVDDADPTHLEFEYMQHAALVIDAVHQRPEPLRALHLGGGALTMPRWVAATRPGSTQVVVDSSSDVLAAGAELGPVAGCDVVVADANNVLRAPVGHPFELLVWDLYDGPLAVTEALTLESVAAMRAQLDDTRGLAVLNVSDATPFDVVRPVVAALHEVFGDAVVLAEPSTLRGRRSGNCVLAATVAQRVPVATLVRRAAAAPVRARVLAGASLHEFVAGAVPATDDRPLPPPDARLGRGFL